MAETALERVARSLDLIPYLVSHPGTSISRLAEVFGTSSLAITKDLSLLHMCGLPGYSHLELIDINYEDPEYVEVIDPQVLEAPRKLSQAESISLLLGLEQLASLAKDNQTIDEILALKAKISAAIGDMEIHARAASLESEANPLVGIVQEAISQRSFLEFTYVSAISDQVSHRVVAPLRLSINLGVHYLHAIDKEIGEERTFKIAHITEARLLDESAIELLQGNQAREDVGDSHPNSLDSELLRESTIVQISLAALYFIEENQAIIESHLRRDNYYEVVISPINEEWLLRALLGLPGPVTILRPKSLESRFKTMVEQTLYEYDSTVE